MGVVHQSAEVVKELFASEPSLYTRIAVISFYPHILYRVSELAVGCVCVMCVHACMRRLLLSGGAVVNDHLSNLMCSGAAGRS